MKTLYVLYDVECAFCLRCRDWLKGEPAFVELRFVPKQAPEAVQAFPGIESYLAEGELVVVSDEGGVYHGPSAFIMCLYALVEYREWSHRLAQPALLPLARKAFELISHHRAVFSNWLQRWNNEQLARALNRTIVPTCGEGQTKCLLQAKPEVE